MGEVFSLILSDWIIEKVLIVLNKMFIGLYLMI